MHGLLANEITLRLTKKEPVVVAICGAADLGKSTLARKIIAALKALDISAGHLTLDSFLLDREERQRRGLSGYQIASYQLPEALDAVRRFKQQQPIFYPPYDHASGKKAEVLATLPASSVLIFDGLHSMHESFSDYVDYRIFISTEDEQLKRLRMQADISKRGQTQAFAQANAEAEFQHYNNAVAPYKTRADHQLFLTTPWLYTLI